MNKHLLISCDVEADGPCPGLYSMVSFGMVVVEPELNRKFYSGVMKPLSAYALWIPEALAVSGVSRKEQLDGISPQKAMINAHAWLKSLDANVTFISDNNGFDWQFINYYFHEWIGENPFGFSSRRITDLWAGFGGSARTSAKTWKSFRKTKHTHNPLDDAIGNAEALLEMNRRGLQIL